MDKHTVIFFLIILCACNNSKRSETKTQVNVEIKELNSVTVADMTLENTVSITMQDRDRQILSLGSGVILDNGKVITNVHVIEGASFGYVQRTNSQDKLNIAGYFIVDKYNDLAILSVPEIITQKKITIKKTFPKVGEKIYAAGNPQGLSGTFTEGNVSAIREIENSSLIQISAPISPGSSGGAIVNSAGELIGIAVGGIENGQNLNFAIPAKYVDSILSNSASSVTNKLDLHKANSSARREIKNASEFVMVKNIIWYYECADYASMFNGGPPDNPIVEFSIYNNTNQSIKDVIIIIIIYDRDGLPVDYQTTNTGRRIGTIIPGLAKKYINIECDYSDYIRYKERGIIWLSKKRGYKAVFRVLDYKIVKE